MSEITEFLAARLDEDEAVARTDAQRMFGSPRRWGKANAARRVVDLAAKQAIVKRLAPYDDIQVRRQTRTLAGDTLRLLASPYAGHPDYREEWKP